MRFEIITLFPELFEAFGSKGLVGKANEAGTIRVRCTNPRDYAKNKHKSVDDAPYGGGSGMVMMPGPVLDALEVAEQNDDGTPGRVHRILLSPQGKPFDQATARRLATLPAVALVCGRYEGIDERVAEQMDEELSLGDFVMTGGEVAAMAIVEATARLLPGVLGNLESTVDESHAAGALEYPQYTRPPEFRGRVVPDVLSSGNHASVARWRRKEALRRTRVRRPDLFAGLSLDATDRTLLAELDTEGGLGRTPVYIALVHYPVKDRFGNVATTAVTNLDVHDLSRSSRTFGIRGYFVVTPIEAQRELVHKILEHWVEGSGKARVPERGQALSVCKPIPSIDDAIAEITAAHGVAPVLAITAARLPSGITPRGVRETRAAIRASERPWLILFGTGHGLAENVLNRAEVALPPIRPGTYNHLSVRAACAILLDRLFGDEGA
jgi:tRNA (guanine37-N1)-methyltransferase